VKHGAAAATVGAAAVTFGAAVTVGAAVDVGNPTEVRGGLSLLPHTTGRHLRSHRSLIKT
jgi:hypothetical protein